VTTPASLDGLVLRSAGCRLLGALHRAAGDERLPAVLLLHGIPGHEKNLDLAVELRDRGVHVLHIHYRGCWGSEGDYSLTHLLPDARTALEWLAVQPFVDPVRIALVGISLGGWLALALASQADGVCAVVSLSPLLDAVRRPLPPEEAAEFAASLDGTHADQLRREWAALTPVHAFASRLARTPFLLVTAGGDTFFPPEHYSNLPAELERVTHVRFPRADHVFSDVRPGLRHVVCQWLLERFDLRPVDGLFPAAAGDNSGRA
jgi:dipeptidyl aminopeptidase/acylaminoacyl peptidase